MLRSHIAFLLAFGCLFTGCAGADEFSRAGLIGVWEGDVVEGDVRYDLRMQIASLDANRPAGTAWYSGAISCVGTLSFLEEQDGVFSFRERVDDMDACADEGRVDVWRDVDGSLRWEWYRSDQDTEPDAVAILRRGA